MAGAGNSHNLEYIKPHIFEVVNDLTHGFVMLEGNSTSLTIQYIAGLEQKVLDSFTLSKEQ